MKGLDDVSEGLVISDDPDDTEEDPNNIVAEGNQFVWVPVSKKNFEKEFVRHDFGNQNISDENLVSGQPVSWKYAELAGDGINVDTEASESVQEVQKMYKSVRDNGGFYIGRYEAGVAEVENVTGSGSSSSSGSNSEAGSGIRETVVSKKGVKEYNIVWADTNAMANEKGGAVEVARGFAGEHNYETVTSTLVYGVQWDAVMRWINNDNNLKGYLTDSSPVGNYTDSDSTNNPAKTGAVKEYQLKNIYDMAGNVNEWTMETYSGSWRVVRGGSYGDDGAYYPVSYRGYTYPYGDSMGFRVALYL